jgi:prepilin-type processing-associated H-X9-DG protein
MYEEDQATIDDGHGILWTENRAFNLLALRHEWKQRLEADAPTVAKPITNPGARGNVAFCDGHVDYVSRSYAHAKEHAAPNVP